MPCLEIFKTWLDMAICSTFEINLLWGRDGIRWLPDLFFFFYLKGISLAAVCDFCLLSVHCTPLGRVWPCLPYRLLQAVENFRPTSLPSYRLNKTATPFMQCFQAPQAFRWPSEFASPSQQLSHTGGTSTAAIFDFLNISSAFLLPFKILL